MPSPSEIERVMEQAAYDFTTEYVTQLAQELCDTWYLTVDPKRPMRDAWNKISLRTQQHWKAQALMLMERGWRKNI
jgi:hypothetical protein